MARSAGRPKSDNPKDIQIKARVDAETAKSLEEYCEKTGKTKTDVILEGIRLILSR